MMKKLRGKNRENISDIPRHRSILFRTVFLSWLLVLFTAIIFIFSIIPFQRSQLEDELFTRAKVIASSIAQVTISSILLEDYSSVVDHCLNVVNENQSIMYAIVTRNDGFSLCHTRGKWSQRQLSGMWLFPSHSTSNDGRFLQSDIVQNEVFHTSFPLNYSGINWGLIHIGLSPEKFYRDLKALYFRIFMIALLSISVGFLFSYFFANRLSKPILMLEKQAKRIGSGDLLTKVSVSTGDEIESLAKSFNQMAINLNKSQEDLQTAHKSLMEAARNSGMAEVATGVLHNVGNVLNSIGIIISSLKTRISDLRIGYLSQTAEQLREHQDDLYTYIFEDDRGRKLTTFLNGLSQHFTDEQKAIIEEVETLTGHIHHVIDIIALQQIYAGKKGPIEPVYVNEIIADAIQINKASLERHEVNLSITGDTLPRVYLDRHKVLQILINLISNAKYALIYSQSGKRCLNIRVDGSQDQLFRIIVSDNGIGISQENMERIFSYGFTTRHDGHGFGLHSGAISAKEMNGSLTAFSQGPSKGATFTLELPLNPVEALNE